MPVMRRSWCSAIFFCVSGLAAATLAAQNSGLPTITAEHAESKITLDGVLNEEAWKKASVIRDLVQQSPNPGKETPFLTEVRVLVDSNTLYLGITCADPEYRKIAVHTMQRDGDMSGDDSVAFVLNTSGPSGGRVKGYYFRVNAAGARWDGLINDPEHIPSDWDGVWDARVSKGDWGWTAEIAIPALTLSFTKGQPVWFFNIERFVARDHLTLRWSDPHLDAKLADFARAGHLAGVGKLHHGLSVSPYALAEAMREFTSPPSSETKLKAGLDVTGNLGPALTGVLTLNTDFAETDVDTRQINLTRFPLYYPEKRQFFNESANQFAFGLGLALGLAQDFIPFYSRRVGLYKEEQVPLLGGIKLIGSQGSWDIGLLDVQTKDIPHTPGSNLPQAPSTNLFAGRVTYNVGDHLCVGAIATNGNPDGVSSNSLAGVDAVWRTSKFRGNKDLNVGTWAAASSGDIPAGKRTGYGFEADYPNDLWDMMLAFKEFGDALDPALGFLLRPGTRWYQGKVLYQPRPQHGSVADWAQQLSFGINPSVVEGLDGKTQSWSIDTSLFAVETKSGDRIAASWQPEYQAPTETFEPFPGVSIPPGAYRFDGYTLAVSTSKHRPWQIETVVRFGTYYSGRMTQWNQSVSYTTPEGHLQLEFDMENAFGYLPEGNFIKRLFQLKVVYAFTPDLIFSYYAQYDNESNDLGVNARLRWTIRPGTDLYLVWNHNWDHPVGSESSWTFEPVSDQAVVKLRYTWRS